VNALVSYVYLIFYSPYDSSGEDLMKGNAGSQLLTEYRFALLDAFEHIFDLSLQVRERSLSFRGGSICPS
jgi:hypothetical protein